MLCFNFSKKCKWFRFSWTLLSTNPHSRAFGELIIELGLIGTIEGRYTTGEYRAGENVIGVICGLLIRKRLLILSAACRYWRTETSQDTGV